MHHLRPVVQQPDLLPFQHESCLTNDLVKDEKFSLENDLQLLKNML